MWLAYRQLTQQMSMCACLCVCVCVRVKRACPLRETAEHTATSADLLRSNKANAVTSFKLAV